MDKKGFDQIRHELDKTGALFYIKPEPRPGEDIRELEIQVWEPHDYKFIINALKAAGLYYNASQSGISRPSLSKVGKVRNRLSTAAPSPRKIQDIPFMDMATIT